MITDNWIIKNSNNPIPSSSAEDRNQPAQYLLAGPAGCHFAKLSILLSHSAHPAWISVRGIVAWQHPKDLRDS